MIEVFATEWLYLISIFKNALMQVYARQRYAECPTI